jgi:hypothetical protein
LFFGMPGIVSCAERSAPLASWIGADICCAVPPSSAIQATFVVTFCSAPSAAVPDQNCVSLVIERLRSSEARTTD